MYEPPGNLTHGTIRVPLAKLFARPSTSIFPLPLPPSMTIVRVTPVAPPPVPGVVEAAVVAKLKIWPFVVVPAAFTAITLK